MNSLDYEITDAISEQDHKSIYEGLLRYNLERLEDKSPKDLGVFLKDDHGNIIAGLTGTTHGNWLLIKFLWVGESLRGRHIGSDILQQAEEKARERGCKFAFLDTFSFQAPLFYLKHGYREVFALEEYPLIGKRHYFKKNL